LFKKIKEEAEEKSPPSPIKTPETHHPMTENADENYGITGTFPMCCLILGYCKGKNGKPVGMFVAQDASLRQVLM